MGNKEKIFISGAILFCVLLFFGAIIAAIRHNVNNGFKVPIRKDVAYYQVRDSQSVQDSFILEMRRDLDRIIKHK